jgi:ribosomal protein S27AE
MLGAGRVDDSGADRARPADPEVPVSQIRKDQPYQPADDDLPGDPVCLLRRVCQRCGSVADEDPPTACPTCHAAIPAD